MNCNFAMAKQINEKNLLNFENLRGEQNANGK